MTATTIGLTLLFSSRDPHPSTSEFDQALQRITERLRASGAGLRACELRGEFEISDIDGRGPELAIILGSWIGLRYGRKISLTIQGDEIVASDVSEIVSALVRIREFQSDTATSSVSSVRLDAQPTGNT